MNFAFIDIFYSILIIIFAIIAVLNGFLKEFFSKIAILAAFIVCFIFGGRFSVALLSIIKNSIACTLIAFIILFIGTYLIVQIIKHLLAGVFSGDIMKGLDRVLGFFFGAVEGLFVIAIIMIFAKAQPWFDLSFFTEKSLYYGLLSNIIAKPILSLSGMFA